MREVVDLCSELIRFRSTKDRPDQIAACADHVCAWLENHGIRFARLEHGGVPSILALPGERSVPVLLMSHLDVVDGPDELFEPRAEQGRLVGRGALDDKYAVALSMVLMKEHLQRLKAHGKGQESLGFGILVTGDEESGGHDGAERALDHVDPEYCIALDGGGLKTIVVKEKGVLRIRLTSRGKSAHASRPWLGENAVDALIRDYHALRELFDPPAGPFWQRTMNLGMIQGGKAFNQVPDLAQAVLDVRFTESDDPDALCDAIRRRVAGEIEFLLVEPVFQGGDSPYTDRLLELNPGAVLDSEHGASDARFLMARGVPGVVWGPDGDESLHSDHEFVHLDSLESLYRILDAFLADPSAKKHKGF